MFHSCLSCLGWTRKHEDDDAERHDEPYQPDSDDATIRPPQSKTQDAKITALERHFNQLHREFNQPEQSRQQSRTSQYDNDEDESTETTALLHASPLPQSHHKKLVNETLGTTSIPDDWPPPQIADHDSIPVAKFGLDQETLCQLQEACESRTWESIDAPTEEEYNTWRVTTASAAPKGDIERPVRAVRTALAEIR